MDPDNSVHVDVRCPNCGSGEIEKYCQGIIRYRISGGRASSARREGIMRESEDPIFHRCIDCNYSSETDSWAREARRLEMMNRGCAS